MNSTCKKLIDFNYYILHETDNIWLNPSSPIQKPKLFLDSGHTPIYAGSVRN